MTASKIPRVFLSASIPPVDLAKLRTRPDGWEDLFLGYGVKPGEVESTVRGIVPQLLKQRRSCLVFGGHPSITPMISNIGRLLQRDERRVSIEIYQSAFFAGKEDLHQRRDEVIYSHIQWTPICRPGDLGPEPVSDLFALGEHPLEGDSPIHRAHQQAVEELDSLDDETRWLWREASLLHMRRTMIPDCDAAIFVGGMEGIEEEVGLFREFNPQQPAWLITRPGGRTERIAETWELPRHWHVAAEWAYEQVGEAIWIQVEQDQGTGER